MRADDIVVKPQMRARRRIYLLPNLLTTAALFAGFYAIIAANDGRFETAAIAIVVAMCLDGLDGRVARLINAQSEFGAQYDSLADVVSFGVAPALVMYEWSLYALGGVAWGWGNLGWVAAFLFAACTALRLARFNTQIGTADKRFFTGLASPAAAAFAVGWVWVAYDLGYSGAELAPITMAIAVCGGLLMVSNFKYYSFKDFKSQHRISFVALLLIVLLFVFTSIDPPKVIFLTALVYAGSGPVWSLSRLARKRLR